MSGFNLQEAFEPAKMKTATEENENPQAYEQPVSAYQHVKPARHILGLYGGNEVSGIQGNRVDLESDLMGITRPTTWCNDRQHNPPRVDDKKIVRKNNKENITIDVKAVHQPTYQMWAYPATFAPEPFRVEACQAPHKF